MFGPDEPDEFNWIFFVCYFCSFLDDKKAHARPSLFNCLSSVQPTESGFFFNDSFFVVLPVSVQVDQSVIITGHLKLVPAVAQTSTGHSALWLRTAKEELSGCGISRPIETTCFWRLAR